MSGYDQSVLPSRRIVLLGLGGSVLAGPVSAQAQPYNRVSADVRPLREKGLGQYAAFVGNELTRAMQSSFAGRIGVRGAPDLVARITLVQLATLPDGGGGGRRWGDSGGGSSDYMDGEALIIDRGRVVRQYPQLMSFPSNMGGAWFDPDNEIKRTAALCRGYASWLARAL